MVLAMLGCGFESGGIAGASGSASLGTADGDGSSSTGDDGPSASTAAPSGSGSGTGDPDTDPDPDATAGDPTTATTEAPTGTSTTDGTDTDTTGEPEPPTDTGSSTTTTGEGGESSSDGGDVQDPPYYGDCTADADCGDGSCTYIPLQGPDAAVCVLPCDEGVCPDPPDGQAEPICTITDGCALDCGADVGGCPTGMTCYVFQSQNGPYARCLWTQD